MNANTVSAEYSFARAKCLRWAFSCFAAVVASVALAVMAHDQRFVEGLLPGWLFGSLGASLVLVVGSSWLVRAFHFGPALVLDESGITTDKLLGGPLTPRIAGVIPWSEVASVAPGAHGSVDLELREHQDFWSRQSTLSRILAWHPLRGRGAVVSLGGSDLDGEQLEIVKRIEPCIDGNVVSDGTGDRPPRPLGRDQREGGTA